MKSTLSSNSSEISTNETTIEEVTWLRVNHKERRNEISTECIATTPSRTLRSQLILYPRVTLCKCYRGRIREEEEAWDASGDGDVTMGSILYATPLLHRQVIKLVFFLI
ncbi:PREDICTED: uncharacterized protein LOC108748846 [Trachymyrmex septentrionalis]|uniref:uncharacterized protein LOC108748846 n=1 Tax=Trachymyrmex septentrionalis TaxID=34720 RepID=UPI00084EED7B|nr:PREDICTED: uncharacterized protein LOC108748846 [Trachymyrmex septentrionalis]